MNVFTLITGIAFVGAGVFILWTGRDPMTAWMAITFFGACALIAAWDIVTSRAKRSLPPAAMYPQRRTLIVYNSVSQNLVYTVGCAGFACAGVMMIERQPFIGWLTAGFFGPGALLLLWQLLDRRPRLVIDGDGVIDRTLGVGLIAWADIESAYRQSIQGNDFICLVLRDPSIYLERMSFWRRKLASANRVLGFTDLNLNLAGVKASPEEVLQIVMFYIADQKASSSSSFMASKYWWSPT